MERLSSAVSLLARPFRRIASERRDDPDDGASSLLRPDDSAISAHPSDATQGSIGSSRGPAAGQGSSGAEVSPRSSPTAVPQRSRSEAAMRDNDAPLAIEVTDTQGSVGQANDAQAAEAVRCDGGASSCFSACSPRTDASRSSDSGATCLICLERMDLSNIADVAPLGCQCKGAAAHRHRACLNRWLLVKGDTVCDVCRSEMTAVTLPPPPPVPGYVVFPDLDHSFEVQWATFGRYLRHNTIAVVVYCIALALVMDVKLLFALMIAVFMVSMLLVRYVVTVAINTIARRTILSFQAPEGS